MAFFKTPGTIMGPSHCRHLHERLTLNPESSEMLKSSLRRKNKQTLQNGTSRETRHRPTGRVRGEGRGGEGPVPGGERGAASPRAGHTRGHAAAACPPSHALLPEARREGRQLPRATPSRFSEMLRGFTCLQPASEINTDALVLGAHLS